MVFLAFMTITYYFQPYMFPIGLLLLFLKNYIIMSYLDTSGARQQQQQQSEEHFEYEDDENEEDKEDKEEKKSLKARLQVRIVRAGN